MAEKKTKKIYPFALMTFKIFCLCFSFVVSEINILYKKILDYILFLSNAPLHSSSILADFQQKRIKNNFQTKEKFRDVKEI